MKVALLVVSDDKDKVYVYLHRGAIINGMEVIPTIKPHMVMRGGRPISHILHR